MTRKQTGNAGFQKSLFPTADVRCTTGKHPLDFSVGPAVIQQQDQARSSNIFSA